MAKFHQVIGSARRARLYAHCKDLLRAEWFLDRLNERDLERAIAAQTFDPLALEMGQAHGFSAFLTFVFWQGVFVELEEALTKPLADNGYGVRELVVSYLRRFDTAAATPEALGGELRNAYWENLGAKWSLLQSARHCATFCRSLTPTASSCSIST